MQQTRTASGKTLLTPDTTNNTITTQWFDSDHWRQQDKIYATKTGRASTYFFHHDGLKAVLRHYWRGGLIGKLLSDQYLFTGLQRTRVYREFALLEQMYLAGLKVPYPIAAQITRCGLIYRGDIITRAIDGAASLLDVLKQRAITDTEFNKVADTLAEFHNQGICHADLNINNILFDGSGEVYLIDFDRGEKRQPAVNWQQANMARLKRSFDKEAQRQPRFFWDNNDWQRLEQRYLMKLNRP